MRTPSPSRRRRTAGRLAAAGVAAALLVVVGASPAGADTSAAAATAQRIAGTPFPETATASNDGTQGTVTSGTGAPTALPDNDVVGAGALGQIAVANDDGTSAACAGLIAPSSEIAIAPNGVCDPGTTASGVTLDLGGLLALNAGSITAECTASSTGEPTGRARLANAGVTSLGIAVVALDSDPAPNTVVGVQGVLDLTLNGQTVNPDGSITVTALSFSLLGQGLIEIGQVTCGPNEVAAPIPLVPAEGHPLAGAVLLLGGALLVLHRRRQTPATA
ncbi:MAG TPA: choice-of-anchor P family protein [Iamia sp.]|nr:choice-of-anchor P family protein [Iamia sp.]